MYHEQPNPCLTDSVVNPLSSHQSGPVEPDGHHCTMTTWDGRWSSGKTYQGFCLRVLVSSSNVSQKHLFQQERPFVACYSLYFSHSKIKSLNMLLFKAMKVNFDDTLVSILDDKCLVFVKRHQLRLIIKNYTPQD